MKKLIPIIVFLIIASLIAYNFYQQKFISSTKFVITPTKIKCNFEKSLGYYSYHDIKIIESEIKKRDDNIASDSALLTNLKKRQPPKYAPMNFEKYSKLMPTKNPSLSEEKYNEILKKSYQDFTLKAEESWKTDVENFNKINQQKIEKAELLIDVDSKIKNIATLALKDVENCKLVNKEELNNKANQIMLFLKQQNEQINLKN